VESNLDPVAALQHRNRKNVHKVKGLQSHIGNYATLIKRDGVPNEDQLVRQLRHYERILEGLAEEMLE
jgi:hypothetical protein